MKMADHLRIENDHKNTEEQAFEPLDYESASNEELLNFVKNAGMLGLGGAGFPTYVKFLKPENVGREQDCEEISRRVDDRPSHARYVRQRHKEEVVLSDCLKQRQDCDP